MEGDWVWFRLHIERSWWLEKSLISQIANMSEGHWNAIHFNIGSDISWFESRKIRETFSEGPNWCLYAPPKTGRLLGSESSRPKVDLDTNQPTAKICCVALFLNVTEMPLRPLLGTTLGWRRLGESQSRAAARWVHLFKYNSLYPNPVATEVSWACAAGLGRLRRNILLVSRSLLNGKADSNWQVTTYSSFCIWRRSAC